jgi:hypothetical protein
MFLCSLIRTFSHVNYTSYSVENTRAYTTHTHARVYGEKGILLLALYAATAAVVVHGFSLAFGFLLENTNTNTLVCMHTYTDACTYICIHPCHDVYIQAIQIRRCAQSHFRTFSLQRRDILLRAQSRALKCTTPAHGAFDYTTSVFCKSSALLQHSQNLELRYNLSARKCPHSASAYKIEECVEPCVRRVTASPTLLSRRMLKGAIQ